MSRPDSPVRTLRTRLAGLRRRIHALFALQGLGRFLVAMSGLLLAFFLADWLLDLPLGVRRFVRLGLLDQPYGISTAGWVVLLVGALGLTLWASRQRLGAAPLLAFLTGGITGLGVWLAWRFLGPTAAHLSDEELALAVEHRYASLNDRLAAALDFDAELARPTRGESESMMRAVVEEAAEEAQHLEFAQAVTGRRAVRWLGAAATGLLVALGLWLAAGDSVSLWARRSLLLEDTPWPRRTTILAVDLQEDGRIVPREASRAFEVAVGRPLVVHAFAEGRIPDEVTLIDRVDGGRALPRRLFAVPEREGLFLVEIRDVRRPFEFSLVGGDDDDELPIYRVEVVVPPRVLAIGAELRYPAYLARDPETQEGGNFVVPEGTEVSLAVEADVPVASARLVHSNATVVGVQSDDEGRRFTFTMEANASTRYRIALTTAEGRESDPSADTYEIVVEADKAPVVRWLYPRGLQETTPNGRVPLLAVVEDDHAVQGVRLHVRLGGDVTHEVDLVAWGEDEAEGTLEGLDGTLGRKIVHVYVPLEIASLRGEGDKQPAPPDRLTAYLVATDSKTQSREGPKTSIDVSSPQDLERALGQRRAAVRSRFELLRDDLTSRREQLAGVTPDALDDGERDVLRAIQFGQAKIAQDVDDATRDLLGVFNTFVYDRLGAEGPTERILAIFHRHHSESFGDVEPGGAASAREVGDPVFPYALYEDVIQAWRDRQIFDTGLVDRMLGAIAPATQAAADLAPHARELARRVAAEELEPAALLAAQDVLIQALDETLERMRTWKRLNDLIVRLRNLIEEQRALDQRLAPRGARPQ